MSMLLAPPRTERPLLLLHGFAGQPHAWDEAVEGLDVDAVRVRLPGHGPAPTTTGETFEDVVDALAAELPKSSICDLAAYSMGARIALGLMVRHPDRVGRAVLVGVSPGLPEEERPARQIWDHAWAKRIDDDGLDAFAEAWSELPLFASQRRLPQATRDAQQRDRRNHTADGLAWAMRHLGTGRMPSYWDALSKVQAEIALVVGALDDKYVTIASQMATRLPHADVVEVNDVGHNVLLEAPDACRDVMRRRH